MKIGTLCFLVLMLAYGCNNDGNKEQISTDVVNNPITANNENADMSSLPQFEFANLDHDFGVIIQKEKVSHTYKFKNTGGSDLILSSVKASCGCTVPKWSREPIAPGEEGEIEVVFDSDGRSGKQHKTITVLANTQPNKVELSFTAEVLVPEEAK
ncbi:MAG: DUF1573 domain-containing protein [Bacteroidota bacterium]